MAFQSWSFDGIGTKWTITADVETATWRQIQREIYERIGNFDQTYSRFRSDSWVAELSRHAGNYHLPPDGADLLAFYERLYRATDGRVTPLIGQVMADAGYDADYSFASRPLQSPPAWDDTIELEPDKITLHQPAWLDFGAAGKGYLVDIVGRLLRTRGVTSFFIDAGGDLLHAAADGEAVRVGLEDPADPTQALGVANLSGRSLCASSGSRRQWGDYHHIIDPQRLASPRDILATWVVADDAMTADGLATALFFVEPQRLQAEFDFDYAVLGQDYELRHSAGFGAELFTSEAR